MFGVARSGNRPEQDAALTQKRHGVTEIIPGLRPPDGSSIASNRCSPAFSARSQTITQPLLNVAIVAAWRDAGQKEAGQ